MVGLVALAGCGTLPGDGPSAKDVTKHAQVEKSPVFSLVNLDYRAAQTIKSVAAAAPEGLEAADSDAPNNLISKGDVLNISIFEQGSAPLFSHSSLTTSAVSAGVTGAGANQDSLPRITVDEDGRITLPFAGVIQVEGLTTDSVASKIRRALAGRTVDPQVLVSVLSSAQNSVTVLGEVRSPGRFPVSANNDRILDLIADAGGPSRPARDIRVYIVRGDRIVAASLETLMEDPQQNIRLAPHDQVRLLLQERKFSTFGALGHVNQMSFGDDHLSLADAISRDGGLDTNSADDSAVFVFRFERPAVAVALGLLPMSSASRAPIIYRLNMRDPNSYFVASDFEILPNDLVYVPRASSVNVRKFLDLVNVLTSVTYTTAVTSTLP